ncbi:MAG: TetR/AcrR family transcriptional regulator C-terminal domain-containing protein [Clostridiales bacterium]|nr:TetR/AcrR family transcriptional regulator C-terminal domain-containing protein [Clostridiales bacterium]
MENTAHKPDRRVARTKKAIKNAFAELMSEKEISEITVKDIAETADVNRKTFYNYYNSVYDIVNEIENELVLAFDNVLSNIDFKQEMKNPYGIFEKLTGVINQDFDFYSRLMKMNHNANLMQKLYVALKDRMKASFLSQTDIEEPQLDIVVNYMISGMLSVYQSWFNSDRAESIEELSKTVSIMTFSGINGFLH